MRLRNWYDLEVNSDRSEKVRYSCADVPYGFFKGRHSAYANNSMPAHWHEDIEILVPAMGELIYNINGKLVRVRTGEGIIINSRRIHSSQTEDLRECYYYVLIFHPMLLCISKEVEQQLVHPFLNSSFDYILLQKGVEWQENILNWFMLMDRKRNDKTAKSAIAGMINLIWSEVAENVAPDEKPQTERSQLTAMKAMIAYIDGHYAEKISLDDIAAAGFVSKRTCGNMFERFLFTPPMKYLNEYRLKRSIELLRGTNMTVTEIGLACGFSGASYYAESFRRELGISPSEYRRSLSDEGHEQAVLELNDVLSQSDNARSR
ncbi:MAG: helix-turn-helix transcriptional regulator [Ruminococcus sp.]|uniref:AraC family transcriptional regulator n=1 Tax=Ruminococcus sp. TaxID=41978 RepID=UPI0025F2399B|nr:AraC family transcriptional regulator [Ruminococcus sp.]MBR5682386.1 helix-turn-helix transcriptional regulator [Ruminococcus sp.]